jgi:hypothetical protein
MSWSGGAYPAGLLPNALLADLEPARAEREEEARELIAQGYNSTGLALRLYSLEIRLKTLISKQLNLSRLPRACKTHNLAELIIFTGMLEELDQTANVAIRQNWDLLVKYSEQRLNDQRYLPRDSLDLPEFSRHMIALDDPQNGVLTWLSKHP